MPDQEHQIGSWKLELEKVVEGSQSWKVERGSLREDLRERSAMSWKGREVVVVVFSETTLDIRRKNKNVRKKGKEESFMVFGIWEDTMRR